MVSSCCPGGGVDESSTPLAILTVTHRLDLQAGGWWLVAGGWWLMADGWWLVGPKIS